MSPGDDPDEFSLELLETAGAPDETCTYEDPYEFDDGFYDAYTDCYGADALTIVLIAVAEDEGYWIQILGQVVSEADLTAFDETILSSTFEI